MHANSICAMAECIHSINSPMCCRSRHVKLPFASSTKATIPAANGADAEVPVCDTVHV